MLLACISVIFPLLGREQIKTKRRELTGGKMLLTSASYAENGQELDGEK